MPYFINYSLSQPELLYIAVELNSDLVFMLTPSMKKVSADPNEIDWPNKVGLTLSGLDQVWPM